MGQPSTSNQIRAVALKEAVASFSTDGPGVLDTTRETKTNNILKRAEVFASYIEHGVEVDPNA